jgi:DNA-binding transcriptional regulator YdaS (Cro superfamily)
MTAIDAAIKRLTPPTQAELARSLDVRIQQVNHWVRRGWAAPKYAPQIERLTGVSCSRLVADIPDRKHSI